MKRITPRPVVVAGNSDSVPQTEGSLSIRRIRSTLSALKQQQALTEIRIQKSDDEVISGYYNDLEQLLKQAFPYDGKYDIRMTYNSVKSELIDRSSDQLNQLMTNAKQTTVDDDIEKIQWIVIDVDPIRPHGVSSTDGEKAEAKKVRDAIQPYLREQGIFKPLEADSGNGYQLILKVDIENTPENVMIVEKFIKALHFKFSTNNAEIDMTTNNPSGLTMLYGTMVCKGDNTEERPHRRSAITKVPDFPMPVSLAEIKKVADSLPEVFQEIPKPEDINWNIPDIIKKHGLDFTYEKKWDGKHDIYMFGTCPMNSEHTDDGACIVKFANGAVASGCQNNGYSVENWTTLKNKYGIKEEKEKPEKREKQSNVMLSLIKDCQFFHDKDEHGYAVVPGDGHSEIIMIRSKKFNQFLLKSYYLSRGSAPGKDAMNEAVAIAEMKAMFEGDEQVIDKRVAMTKDKEIYYDLADSQCRMVKVSAGECAIVQKAPVYFVRSKNMKAQILPDFTVSPEDLIPLIKKNIRFKDESDVSLFAIYLVTCFIQEIPHPIMVFFGEKGASKSTTMRMIKKIVDPAMQDLLSMPTSKENLALVLNNHYMPAFDNLEKLSAEQSNILCMAATGGAFSKRTLHTDSDETIHEFKRCLLLNGVNIVATKADLVDRSIIEELERIRKDKRLTEKEIWKKFDEDLPKILGAIFKALSAAIPLYGAEKINEVGRMADFTVWGFAIAEALGVTGKVFLDAYLRNQGKANEEALYANPVGAATMALMANKTNWSGSVTNLLIDLEHAAINEHINTRQKLWPADASALSRRINEIQSNLEEVGIYYDNRNVGEFRKITIENKNSLKIVKGAQSTSGNLKNSNNNSNERSDLKLVRQTIAIPKENVNISELLEEVNS